jgi:hypothetical protein
MATIYKGVQKVEGEKGRNIQGKQVVKSNGVEKLLAALIKNNIQIPVGTYYISKPISLD